MEFQDESSVFDVGLRSSVANFESAKKPSEADEKSSIFGESSCGEPLHAQHLSIDFTPSDETDNEFVQKKCVAFWNFINSIPEIQHLKVSAEPFKCNEEVDSSEFLPKEYKTEQEAEDKPPPKQAHTAVTMLEFVEKKGLIDRTFETKLPQSKCSLGSREYREGGTGSHKPVVEKFKSVYNVSENEASAQGSKYAKRICKTMDDWDEEHPKSMEPPCHPPALHHCIMQRKIPQ